MSVNINAKDVMALREKTGLGMMDCKQALIESGGDFNKAIELLRAKLKGKMDLRSDRPSSDGLVIIRTNADGTAAAMVEISTETDFTARNEKTREAAEKIAVMALAGPAGDVSASKEMTDLIDNLRITTGENIKFRRGVKVSGGSVGSYVHHDSKKGVLLVCSAKVDEEIAKGVCQHITAHVPPPAGITEADIPASEVEKVRENAVKEAMESGKPREIAQKMVEGKVRKYLQEITLLNQKYVKDLEGKKTVKEILPSGVTVQRFVRYLVGMD